MPEWVGVPIAVRLDDGRPVITCLNAANADFADPFFDQTIERVRDATPTVSPHEVFRAGLSRSRRPAGFIFHMSRCGSTLVSQLLKEIGGVRVYAEPPPINHALRLTATLAHREIRDLIETLIHAFCMQSARTVFKFSSWNILHYALFAELFPDVPKLFVVRRPLEVLSSIARTPPGFVVRRHAFAEVVRRRAGDGADAFDDLEFAAVLLGGFLEAMVAAATTGSTLVLDYAELPSAAWRTVPSFLGIGEDEIDVARMAEAARFHSKSYPQRVPFSKDETVPYADLATLERHAATWIEPHYDRLIRGA